MKIATLIVVFAAAGLVLFSARCGRHSDVSVQPTRTAPETPPPIGQPQRPLQPAPDPTTYFVYIRIPEAIGPAERVRKYEDPLQAALDRSQLGEITGGGSALADSGQRISSCGLDVELTDLPRGLSLLTAELRRLRAPIGTTLIYEADGKETVLDIYSEPTATPRVGA